MCFFGKVLKLNHKKCLPKVRFISGNPRHAYEMLLAIPYSVSWIGNVVQYDQQCFQGIPTIPNDFSRAFTEVCRPIQAPVRGVGPIHNVKTLDQWLMKTSNYFLNLFNFQIQVEMELSYLNPHSNSANKDFVFFMMIKMRWICNYICLSFIFYYYFNT